MTTKQSAALTVIVAAVGLGGSIGEPHSNIPTIQLQSVNTQALDMKSSNGFSLTDGQIAVRVAGTTDTGTTFGAASGTEDQR
jgi:hypothetical protein